MASRHVSTGAERKKVTTYGLPSRRRHISNQSYTSQSTPASSRLSEPSEQITRGSTIANGRAMKTFSRKGDHKRPQSRNNVTSVELEAPDSCQQSDGFRKRNHSTAFDYDLASETVASSFNFRAHKCDISHQLRRGFDQSCTDGSESTSLATRSPTVEALTLPLSAQSDCIEARGHESALNGPIDAPRGKELSASPPRLRRHRLIDALTAQSGDSPPDPDAYRSGSSSSIQPATSEDESLVQQQSPVVQGDATSRTVDGRGMTLKGRKIRFTYSQSRRILGSPQKSKVTDVGDFVDRDDPVTSTTSELSDPSPAPLGSGDIEGVMNSKIAIQSVHELKRAGANNRFSDEMDDLLFRIGNPTSSPSTMRRNGLCELVHMLQNEEFANQFRDHASRDNIAKGIRDEGDIISGFALAAVLVIFLSSSPAPHMIRQLAEDRTGAWLNRLLAAPDDITAIASQRSLNLPKATRTSLTSVKNILLQMPLWHRYKVHRLSPRTLALQLLAILIRCSEAQYIERFVLASGQDVAEVAGHYAKAESTDDMDFSLLISILEAQSSLAAVKQQVSNMQQQASTVATFLQRTLQRWPDERNDLDATLLKLAINTTNNEAGAGLFDNIELLSRLTDCICSGFALVQHAMGNARFEGDIYDELLLTLGITINILEHCPNARTTASERSLSNLVALWNKNQLLMTEADSVEKSKFNVALGYLAVLLGYLYLTQSSWTSREDYASRPSIQSLVTSIQEFIGMHRSVNSKVYELDGLVRDLQAISRAIVTI